MTNRCRECGQTIPDGAVRVSIHGMYDTFLFTKFEGRTVDEVIEAWREHNSTPNPAIVGDRKVDDLGPASLCPAVVLGPRNEKGRATELRRVGPMVFPDSMERKLKEWRQALLADPDIPRLLAEGDSDE